MYNYPKRKSYKYIIPTTKGDCVLEFMQATANETNEYLEILELLIWDDTAKQIRGIMLQKKYINDFLDRTYPTKRYNIKKRQVLSLVKINIDDYVWAIVWMLHPLRKSIYSDTKPAKVNGKKPKDYPFDNHLEVIAKKTGISIDRLYDRLTIEQIGWYIDKVVYDSYETFKEWQAINAKIVSKWGLNSEQKKDLEIIKKYFSTKKD
jgi:hypothetical protein